MNDQLLHKAAAPDPGGADRAAPDTQVSGAVTQPGANPPAPDSVAILQKAMGKDPDAFTQLIDSQMQLMYKTARSILSSDEDAADAIQEAILRCWEKISTLREPSFFRTWLIRILVNCCYDQLRGRRNMFLSDDGAGANADLPYHENAYNTAEWVQVLNLLEETYRLPMVLYYIDGFTTSQIAQLLEISEGAVRTRLSRGRAMLSQEWKEEKVQ